MGNSDGTLCLCTPRMVPAVEKGDDLPDRSGEPSERIFEGASRRPVALVLDDPTAAAAFWPSVLPTCNRCGGRSEDEFVCEMTESVGLPGLSKVEGKFATFKLAGCDEADCGCDTEGR